MRQRIVVACLLVAVALVAWSNAESLRAWTLVDVPGGDGSQWLATWPGVRGVMLVSADNTSTVQNSINVKRIIDGHDRMTGLTAWRDDEFGTGDLLVYVNSFDDHRVWRYQVDSTTWEVRGQLQMLSPQHPLGLSLATNGDNICVSGDTAAGGETRVVQCYRVSRALSDDGVTIDEWWVMVSNFQWTGGPEDPTHPRAEALLYDANALPTEASLAGSLWVDCKQQPGQLVRFPVDSITGAFMPDFLALPASLPAERLTWTSSSSTGSHLLVAGDSAYEVSWSLASGSPGINAATPLWRATSAHDHLRAVVWRHVSLDPFQRLDLALLGAQATVTFDLVREAIASGEVSASPSITPSTSGTPSEAPATATHTVAPSPSATVAPSPVPSASAAALDNGGDEPLPWNQNDSEKVASGHHNNNNQSLHALWALTSLALPCLCVPVAVWAVWRKRRTLSRAIPSQMTWLKSGQSVQPYSMGVASAPTDGATGSWSQYYDVGDPSAVAIPTTIQNAPLLESRL